jgi:hypothetical protein
MKPVEILEALGFEFVGPDPDERTHMTWLNQQTVRHVHITLPPNPCEKDVLFAIFDAGRKQEWQSIKEKQEAAVKALRYFESIPYPIPAQL